MMAESRSGQVGLAAMAVACAGVVAWQWRAKMVTTSVADDGAAEPDEAVAEANVLQLAPAEADSGHEEKIEDSCQKTGDDPACGDDAAIGECATDATCSDSSAGATTTLTHPESLLGTDGFASLLRNQTCCDLNVTLIGSTADDDETITIPCHFLPLANISNFFKALGESPWKDHSSVTIDPPGGATSFKAILDFAYTASLPLSCENIAEIMSTAQFLLCESVCLLCEQFLQSHVISAPTAGRSSHHAAATVCQRAHNLGACGNDLECRCFTYLLFCLNEYCADIDTLCELNAFLCLKLCDKAYSLLEKDDSYNNKQLSISMISTTAATYLSRFLGTRNSGPPEIIDRIMEHAIRHPTAVPAQIARRLIHMLSASCNFRALTIFAATLAQTHAPGGDRDARMDALQSKCQELEGTATNLKYAVWMGLDWETCPNVLVGARLSVLYPVASSSAEAMEPDAAGKKRDEKYQWFGGVCTSCQVVATDGPPITWHYVVFDDAEETWLQLETVTFRVNDIVSTTSSDAAAQVETPNLNHSTVGTDGATN